MRSEQRPQMDPSWFELTDQWWEPTVQHEDGTTFDLSPRANDRYVVVDEIVERRARLVASPWPVLDRGKRPRFGKGRRSSHVVPTSEGSPFADGRRCGPRSLSRSCAPIAAGKIR
jgi:hypothetical protein